MIFRNLRDPSGPEPGLDKRLQSLEQQADIALPGFDAQFFNRAGDLCVESGDRPRALHYYGRAIDAYLRAGRYNAGGAVCRKLLRVSPGAVRARRKQIGLMAEATRDRGLRAVLADHLAKLGDPEGAERVMAAEPEVAPGEGAEALWSRVLRAVLMAPGDLR